MDLKSVNHEKYYSKMIEEQQHFSETKVLLILDAYSGRYRSLMPRKPFKTSKTEHQARTKRLTVSKRYDIRIRGLVYV